ncbi:MAG: OsmC family protein [Myxococcota bacterium]|jgi:putative redox protein|nr:OsmC family protein [Myxococcota bacterium]
MVEITVDYQGNLRTQALHGPSGDRIETDAPVDNHGKGERFSPTDLVAAAVGSCMLTVMGIVAERHGWALAGARARTEKHMVEDPVRRIGSLGVELWFPAGLPEESRKPLLRAAQSCPVKQSLHPDIAVDVRVTWAE